MCVVSYLFINVNKTNFHNERLHTRTRFETEAKGNSEIAYSMRAVFLSQGLHVGLTVEPHCQILLK